MVREDILIFVILWIQVKALTVPRMDNSIVNVSPEGYFSEWEEMKEEEEEEMEFGGEDHIRDDNGRYEIEKGSSGVGDAEIEEKFIILKTERIRGREDDLPLPRKTYVRKVEKWPMIFSGLFTKSNGSSEYRKFIDTADMTSHPFSMNGATNGRRYPLKGSHRTSHQVYSRFESEELAETWENPMRNFPAPGRPDDVKAESLHLITGNFDERRKSRYLREEFSESDFFKETTGSKVDERFAEKKHKLDKGKPKLNHELLKKKMLKFRKPEHVKSTNGNSSPKLKVSKDGLLKHERMSYEMPNYKTLTDPKNKAGHIQSHGGSSKWKKLRTDKGKSLKTAVAEFAFQINKLNELLKKPCDEKDLTLQKSEFNISKMPNSSVSKGKKQTNLSSRTYLDTVALPNIIPYFPYLYEKHFERKKNNNFNPLQNVNYTSQSSQNSSGNEVLQRFKRYNAFPYVDMCWMSQQQLDYVLDGLLNRIRNNIQDPCPCIEAPNFYPSLINFVNLYVQSLFKDFRLREGTLFGLRTIRRVQPVRIQCHLQRRTIETTTLTLYPIVVRYHWTLNRYNAPYHGILVGLIDPVPMRVIFSQSVQPNSPLILEKFDFVNPVHPTWRMITQDKHIIETGSPAASVRESSYYQPNIQTFSNSPYWSPYFSGPRDRGNVETLRSQMKYPFAYPNGPNNQRNAWFNTPLQYPQVYRQGYTSNAKEMNVGSGLTGGGNSPFRGMGNFFSNVVEDGLKMFTGYGGSGMDFWSPNLQPGIINTIISSLNLIFATLTSLIGGSLNIIFGIITRTIAGIFSLGLRSSNIIF